ncbi:hypothetical protein AKJ09_09572 [Labilithrix luteola]|uniref:Uncharacterized protein n=1 Tax=Labilithrix luteola TaxID=1391654 RepID=A0A0K1QAZ5_9BACT|nr:hypothetical protein [Labilithrix luteola]AKV02909.1 hypothetical protein AKJ09_09572 [Labilithrix luteola]
MTQDEHQRVQRIKEYVLARLREELGNAPRGAQAQLAKRLGVSGAHLSNMLSPNPTRQPGEDFRRKVAAHWGFSYAQMEALALGEEAPVIAPRPVGFRLGPPPINLSGVLAEYAWMPELPQDLREIVREQARLHHRFSGVDYSRDEWQRIVTGLEREVLGLLAWRAQSSTEEDPEALTRRNTTRRPRRARS